MWTLIFTLLIITSYHFDSEGMCTTFLCTLLGWQLVYTFDVPLKYTAIMWLVGNYILIALLPLPLKTGFVATVTDSTCFAAYFVYKLYTMYKTPFCVVVVLLIASYLLAVPMEYHASQVSNDGHQHLLTRTSHPELSSPEPDQFVEGLKTVTRFGSRALVTLTEESSKLLLPGPAYKTLMGFPSPWQFVARYVYSNNTMFDEAINKTTASLIYYPGDNKDVMDPGAALDHVFKEAIVPILPVVFRSALNHVFNEAIVPMFETMSTAVSSVATQAQCVAEDAVGAVNAAVALVLFNASNQ
jgi:hypothetical protein